MEDNDKNKTDAEIEDQEPSMEDIEKLILEKDPNFLKSLHDIDKDLDSGELLEAVETDNVEIEDKAKHNKFLALLLRIPLMPFFVKIAFRIWWKIEAGLLSFYDGIIYFATDGRKEALTHVKNFFKSIGNGIGKFLSAIENLTWTQKFLIPFCALLGFAVYYLGKMMMHGKHFVPEHHHVFVSDFSIVADKSYEFDPNKDMETFYESFRYAQNIFLLDKMVVNLRPSARSTENPMGVFELFVVGFSNEAVVELKFRSKEVKDLAQRTIEEFTYDSLDTLKGKKALKKALIKEFNNILTTGQVKDILIKTIVIKP